MYNTKNFKFQEFTCKCCGKNLIDSRIMDICQAIRDELKTPVYVSSGYRCERNNKRVGGKSGSYHIRGLAADISCCLGSKAIKNAIIRLVIKKEIKISWCCEYKKKNFVHIDIGRKRNKKFAER